MTDHAAPLCPSCREERELRAYLAECDLSPQGKVVQAARASVHTSVFRHRRAAVDQLAASAKRVQQDIDSLIRLAGQQAVVEHLGRAADVVARERARVSELDEAYWSAQTGGAL